MHRCRIVVFAPRKFSFTRFVVAGIDHQKASSSILLILNILSNFQVNLAYAVHSETGSEKRNRMDKINRINKMRLAKNEPVDNPT